MEHVFWLYPDELAGRPGPMVAPWDLEQLKDSGFGLILSTATDLFPHSEAVKAGIARVCIPFPDLLPPDDRVVALCRANLKLSFDLVRETVDTGRSVLVHCAGGYDRTGLVLARYIAHREAVSAEEAIEKLRLVRPYALSAEGWEEMAVRLISEERGRG